MRYFKYKNTKKNMHNALKEHYLSLLQDEKRTFRKEKFWRKLSTIVSIIVFFSCTVFGCYLITLIPMPSVLLLLIPYGIRIVLIGIFVLLISSFLTYGITMPLWKKAESFNLPTIKKEIFSKACIHLRDYYELKEPYIVTKCYHSTDKRFTNHDVCIFIVDGELRITTDLIRGFLYGKKDLGCYALKREDICLSKRQEGKKLIAQLTAKDTVFLLGYRAKSFIEKFLTDN